MGVAEQTVSSSRQAVGAAVAARTREATAASEETSETRPSPQPIPSRCERKNKNENKSREHGLLQGVQARRRSAEPVNGQAHKQRDTRQSHQPHGGWPRVKWGRGEQQPARGTAIWQQHQTHAVPTKRRGCFFRREPTALKRVRETAPSPGVSVDARTKHVRCQYERTVPVACPTMPRTPQQTLLNKHKPSRWGSRTWHCQRRCTSALERVILSRGGSRSIIGVY